MDSLEKITPVLRNKSAAQMVADKILDLVRSGSLKAGDTLPTENELAVALHVSRPVVREALRGLQILGIVESRQGGRCSITDLNPARLVEPLQFVIALDDTNVDALYEARAAVEIELARLGAARATDDQLAQLSDLVRTGHALAADPIAFRVLDQEFHRLLSDAGGNPFLSRMSRMLYDIGIEFRRIASEKPGVIARSAAEHEQIVASLRARDPEGAVAAMSVHLSSISRTTLEAMRTATADSNT